MLDLQRRSWLRPLGWLSGLALATAFLAFFGREVVPPDKLCPDFIQFWTAATLLRSGQSPYDADLQASIQGGLGWDKAKAGHERYDFLPYFYPPWLGLACVPLLPLGYEAARLVWFVLLGDFLLLTGFLLKDSIAGVPRMVPLLLIPLFELSVLAAIMGQLSPLVLFLLAAIWRLLDGRRDVAAGLVLGLATFKPQLTALVVLGTLLWAARRGRWGVVMGFGAALAALCLVGTLFLPSWPIEMVMATRVTPLPTEYFPSMGATWYTVLKSAGVNGWPLWVGYLGVALPWVIVVLRSSLNPSQRWEDLLSLGLIATFFVAPYGRHYDIPVLLIPVLVLLGTRLPEKPGAALLMALLVLPYVHYVAMVRLEAGTRVGDLIHQQVMFFCIPLLIATAWWLSRHRGANTGGRTGNTRAASP